MRRIWLKGARVTAALPRCLALPLALAASSTLTACGGDDPRSESFGFERDQESYALPFDLFVGTHDDLVAYAESTLVTRCMERQGHSWPMPVQGVGAPPRPTRNTAGNRLFNVALARRYGYRDAPYSAGAVRAQKQFEELNSTRPSRVALRSVRECRESAREQLPRQVGAVRVFRLAVDANETAQADERTLEAAERWRECMAPLGISDLPDAPLNMPSRSIAMRFGLDPDGSSAPPSAEEIGVATADARCRDSSGYATRFYDAEVDRQLELIADNREWLDRVRAANDRSAKRARSVIERHGG